MRLRHARPPSALETGFVLVASLAGCTAVSDFDYKFNDRAHEDAGGAGGDGGQFVDMDAKAPLDGSFSGDGSHLGDATGTTADGASCTGTSCCEITEISELSCMDGKDNDCDGVGDCADPDCRQSVECCPNPSFESGDTACGDGKDNDCDGLVDCAQTSCAMVYKCSCTKTGAEDGKNFPARCLNNKDDDCDQLIDCADNDCQPYSGCCMPTVGQTLVETSCSDGLNNDCDSAGADCADPDCRVSTDAGATATSEMGAACTDGKDDDCDGLIDCKDNDCHAELACCLKTPGQESIETSCGDGINNDCDGAGADCYDPDCALDANCCKATAENTDATCTDGVDNDCDGLRDCADPTCNRAIKCCPKYLAANGLAVQATETSCTDAFDNDCDGLLNCADTADCNPKACLIIIRPPIIITDPSPQPIEAASL